MTELAKQQVTGQPALILHVSTSGEWALDMVGPDVEMRHRDQPYLLKPLVRALGVTSTSSSTRPCTSWTGSSRARWTGS